MNPIEFLQQNGYNPDNFRTSVPSGPAVANRPVEYRCATHKAPCRKKISTTTLRKRDIRVVRKELFHEWMSRGEQELTGLFVPYLMLDVFQLTDDEYLRKVNFKHKERKHYTALMDTYSTFNKCFFSQFSEDEKSMIVDMMDSFGDYIHNHVEIFRFNIEGCIMDIDENDRTVCGALCVCKLMISQAVRAWDGMYKGHNQVTDVDSHLIRTMEYHIAELMNQYFKRFESRLQQDVQFTTVDTVRQAETNTVKQILEFLKEYDQQL